MTSGIQIIGGGPAGASAALAALREGAGAHVFEKSRFPRHKVCGEFLSPGILRVLDDFGLMEAFDTLGPAQIRRALLCFGRREKNFRLPETAGGLSRAAFDHLLLRAAEEQGAVITQATATSCDKPAVLARGRHFASTARDRGQRLFGFKAHFRAAVSDAVELYFFDGCYVGLNAVENGITNVCGIAPEHRLRKFNFEQDELLQSCEPLRARLRGAERVMSWLSTGPLRFENGFRADPEEGVYAAGDALSFVDPFTGSGLLAALRTGTIAGQFAAQGRPVHEYLESVRTVLERPFAIAGIFRWAVTSGWAERVAPLLPGAAMFRWTRP